MDNKLYQRILYFIIVTIGLTLTVQLYWNYKNYQKNLQNFQNEVQISLDNALDLYYAELTKKNHMTFIDLEATDNSIENLEGLMDKMEMDSVFQEFQSSYSKDVDSITQIVKTETGEQALTFSNNSNKISSLKVVRGKKAADSIKLLKNITSIYISIQDDSLKLSDLSPLIEKELQRKQLSIPFALKYKGTDSIKLNFNQKIVEPNFFQTEAKSKFLKSDESLLLFYPNATNIVLQQGLAGLLISVVLLLGIIACLIYLLKVIKNQRQLSELKNDLISNITHEFKTPISTIGAALEGIQNFNANDDKLKTKNYLDISTLQLSKLNTMVEKLLETATLDSEHLELHKEMVDISELVLTIAQKHQFQNNSKTLSTSIEPVCKAKVDLFHFENAINNLLDNAYKYGGKHISVTLTQIKNFVEISIADDGNTLTKQNQDLVFEKFYRVPKGNTHDVKGFGIGLYYTKNIIEKHNGKIILELKPQQTTFKIHLPND